MSVTIPLTDEEVAALRELCIETGSTGVEVAHRLLRDALIGCGLLRLGPENRSRHAGGRR